MSEDGWKQPRKQPALSADDRGGRLASIHVHARASAGVMSVAACGPSMLHMRRRSPPGSGGVWAAFGQRHRQNFVCGRVCRCCVCCRPFSAVLVVSEASNWRHEYGNGTFCLLTEDNGGPGPGRAERRPSEASPFAPKPNMNTPRPPGRPAPGTGGRDQGAGARQT